MIVKATINSTKRQSALVLPPHDYCTTTVIDGADTGIGCSCTFFTPGVRNSDRRCAAPDRLERQIQHRARCPSLRRCREDG